MLTYRIQNIKYGSELSGEGAKKFGGRWNPPNVPMIYTSESISLAVLELIVNLNSYSYLANIQYNILTIEIPDECKTENWAIEKLPVDWDLLPHSYATQILGMEWVKQNQKIAIKVPSAIINSEKNILINSLHQDFNKVKVIDVRPFDENKRFNKS